MDWLEPALAGNFDVPVLGPAPFISGISPNSGPPSGGTAVTITGTGFTSGLNLKIGGVDATNVVVVNSTTITARTPAKALGNYTVVVTNPDAQVSTSGPGVQWNSVVKTPQQIFGSRIKRFFNGSNSFGAGPTQLETWEEDIVGDHASCNIAPGITTPAGKEGVGVTSGKVYSANGFSGNTTRYRNLTLFGCIKVPASLVGNFNVNNLFGGGTKWNLYVRTEEGKLGFFTVGSNAMARSDASVKTGQWFHFVCVWTDDGAAGTGVIYLDRVEQATKQSTSSALTPLHGLSLGNYQSASGGQVDMAVFGIVLGQAGEQTTSQELADLFDWLDEQI